MRERKNALPLLLVGIVLSIVLTACVGMQDFAATGTLPSVSDMAEQDSSNEEDADLSDVREDEAETVDASEEVKIDLDSIASELENGNGDESSEEVAEETEDEFTEASEEDKESTDEGLVTKAADISSQTDYTADDVAGYWKYDKFDNMYLALYDTGSYEIYDMESGDVTNKGTFTVKSASVEMMEKEGKDPQVLKIESLARLLDDEGDILSPYIPESMLTASDDGEISRSYGSVGYDDLVTKDDGKGMYKTHSLSRFCWISHPYNYYVGGDGDFLYTYDGDIAYATVRNITNDFHNWEGNVQDFVIAYTDDYLVKDFQYFYGEMENAADLKRQYNRTEHTVCDVNVNLWNDRYDIKCYSQLILSEFEDGTEFLILKNYFYRYGDMNSRERILKISGGGWK